MQYMQALRSDFIVVDLRVGHFSGGASLTHKSPAVSRATRTIQRIRKEALFELSIGCEGADACPGPASTDQPRHTLPCLDTFMSTLTHSPPGLAALNSRMNSANWAVDAFADHKMGALGFFCLKPLISIDSSFMFYSCCVQRLTARCSPLRRAQTAVRS